MEVWFLIQTDWKTPLKTNSSPENLEFLDLPRGILFFQGWPGILHPSPSMDIKSIGPACSKKIYVVSTNMKMAENGTGLHC